MTPPIIISDAERAKRYRRKLEDLLAAANNLLLNLPLTQLTAPQKFLAMTLADEVYLIGQQLGVEKEFLERFAGETSDGE